MISGGVGQGVKKFTKWTRFLNGSWSDGRQRLAWTHSDRSFRATDSRQWIERNDGGFNVFSERARNSDFVELEDPRRGYVVRLFPTEMQIRGGTGVFPVISEFTRIYDGGWVTGRPPGPLTVIVDTHDAPEVADWAAAAKTLCLRWHAILFECLHPSGPPPARTVTIIFKEHLEGIAFTRLGVITINADWIKKHPDDFGMVIHELTHVVQDYGGRRPKNAFWVTEGIADYVRYYDYELQKRVFARKSKTFRDGYATASVFLEWIRTTYDPGIIEQLNRSMQNNTYSDEMVRQFTGRALDDLWSEFVATVERK